MTRPEPSVKSDVTGIYLCDRVVSQLQYPNLPETKPHLQRLSSINPFPTLCPVIPKSTVTSYENILIPDCLFVFASGELEGFVVRAGDPHLQYPHTTGSDGAFRC